MWKTGHSLIKTKMAEIGAPLAGEMSGHIFFADRYLGFDDALYAAIRFLNIVAALDGREPVRTCTTACRTHGEHSGAALRPATMRANLR